jgi:hypothetical protein
MAIDAVNARGSVHARLDTLDHDAKVRGKGEFGAFRLSERSERSCRRRVVEKKTVSEPLRNENKKFWG